jgi:hypothetical protein
MESKKTAVGKNIFPFIVNGLSEIQENWWLGNEGC